MLTHTTTHPRLGLSLSAALIAMLVGAQGCSNDDGFAKRYAVSGTVSYDGKPLPTGKINFIPEAETNEAATGSIIDGKYSLTTHEPGDGAMAGKYKVTITSFGGDLDAVQKKANEAGGSTNAMPDQTDVAAAQKSLIPEKFGSFEGSGLSGEVKAESNTINFDLKD